MIPPILGFSVMWKSQQFPFSSYDEIEHADAFLIEVPIPQVIGFLDLIPINETFAAKGWSTCCPDSDEVAGA